MTAATCLATYASDSDDAAVRRMEEFAVNYPRLVEASPEVVLSPTNEVKDWYRHKVFVRDVAFDVRRTDSLVTPLAGLITYVCGVRGTKGASEAFVRSNPDNVSHDGDQCRAAYAYQASKWVRKDVTCEFPTYAGGGRFVKKWSPVTTESGIFATCMKLLPQD